MLDQAVQGINDADVWAKPLLSGDDAICALRSRRGVFTKLAAGADEAEWTRLVLAARHAKTRRVARNATTLSARSRSRSS